MHIGGTVKTCTAKFVSRKLMQRHIKDLHRYQSPEEKQCKYCRKELKTVRVKKEHETYCMDNPEKEKFMCLIPGCGKEFIRKARLNKHLRIVHNQ